MLTPAFNAFIQRQWANYVLTLGSCIFILGMLQTVLDPSAVVPLETSIPTALALACFTPVQWIALKAKSGAVANAITALLWALVAILRHP